MALHRDIFWVGRQWAVTGHGLQAVDQKQKSSFDIGISRLWEDDLAEGLSAERWFNAEDFGKGLSIARARYPEGSCEATEMQPAPPEPALTLKPAFKSTPLCEPSLPLPEVTPIARPKAVRETDPPRPAATTARRTPSRDAPSPDILSQDTWASLAELVRTITPASPPPVSPQPSAPKPSVFAAPARPAPRLDLPKPAAPIVEPPKRACLPFDMRVEGSGAKFARMWRVRIRR